jgi:hypothetical protein
MQKETTEALPMKKITTVVPQYPFSESDMPRLCNCKHPVLLRKSSLLDKVFVVAEGDQTEIIAHKHKCTKIKDKNKIIGVKK